MKDKALKQYDINVLQLQNKQYVYEMSGDDAFFEAMEQQLIQKGEFQATIIFDKSETMIQANFGIEGRVELLCDRSLETFDYPIKIQERLIYKFGAKTETLSDEIEVIARDTQTINVASTIFEFVGLSLPVKKLHPRYQDEVDDLEEEGSIVFSTNTTTDDDKEEEELPIDPRWEVLQKLKK
jgi:uncharacterized metal-binding protein YceD (DUF177 family)